MCFGFLQNWRANSKWHLIIIERVWPYTTQQKFVGPQDVFSITIPRLPSCTNSFLPSRLEHVWRMPWNRLENCEILRIQEITIIIVKTNNDVESWIAMIMLLLYFHAVVDQSRFSKFYLLLAHAFNNFMRICK